VETILEGKVIICRFDPALYLSHRLQCIEEIIKEYSEKMTIELFDEWQRVARSEDVNEIEEFVTKLERIIGKTILTIPRIHADP